MGGVNNKEGKEMKKHIGKIAVDAGLCWIGDPCYVLPEDSQERTDEAIHNWGVFCNTMRDKISHAFTFAHGHEGLGVCVGTGYGDGLYPVVADIDKRSGHVKSVTITFIGEDE